MSSMMEQQIQSLTQQVLKLTAAVPNIPAGTLSHTHQLLEAMEACRQALRERLADSIKATPVDETSVPDMESTPVPFLQQISTLKHLPRTGWLRFVDSPESVAAHSFRVAVAGLFAPPGLDRQKCVTMGLIHDMAESVVGDIPTYLNVSKSDKYARELSGFEYLDSLLKRCNASIGAELLSLWKEYEAGSTEEAVFVKDMDKFECMVQALEYEQQTYLQKPGLVEFQGLRKKITTPSGKAWLRALDKERDAYIEKRKTVLPILFVTGDKPTLSEQKEKVSSVSGTRLITLDEILHDEAASNEGLHSAFVRQCLESGADIPVPLEVSLVEQKIHRCLQEKKKDEICVLYGFPNNLEELIEFERKVQKPNCSLLLTSAQEPGKPAPGVLVDYLQATRHASYYNAKKLELSASGQDEAGYLRQVVCDGADGADAVVHATLELAAKIRGKAGETTA